MNKDSRLKDPAEKSAEKPLPFDGMSGTEFLLSQPLGKDIELAPEIRAAMVDLGCKDLEKATFRDLRAAIAKIYKVEPESIDMTPRPGYIEELGAYVLEKEIYPEGSFKVYALRRSETAPGTVRSVYVDLDVLEKRFQVGLTPVECTALIHDQIELDLRFPQDQMLACCRRLADMTEDPCLIIQMQGGKFRIPCMSIYVAKTDEVVHIPVIFNAYGSNPERHDAVAVSADVGCVQLLTFVRPLHGRELDWQKRFETEVKNYDDYPGFDPGDDPYDHPEWFGYVE